MNDPDTWPTNYQRAKEAVQRAKDLEWEGFLEEADLLFRRSIDLMDDPDYQEPPF